MQRISQLDARSAILLSLSLTLLAQSLPAVAADEQRSSTSLIPCKAPGTSQKVKYSPDVSLRWLPDNAGYDIGYREAGIGGTNNFDGLLVAIDGTPIAGKTYREILAMLQAESARDVQITYLRRDDSPCTTTLKRKLATRAVNPLDGDSEKYWLAIQAAVLEDENSFENPLRLIREKIDTFAAKNVELCAKASIREAASSIEMMPYEPQEFKYNLLVQTAVDSDTIGDTVFADKCIEQLIDSGKFYVTHSRPYYQGEGDVLIKHLFDTNRRAQCKIFCKRLFEWCDQQNEESLRTGSVYPTQRLALRTYAQILADEHSPEVSKVLEQIIKVDVEISQAFDEDKYGWLGDFYSQIKLYDKALETYEKLSALEILNAAKGNLPIGNVRQFEQFALKQAALQEKLNQPDKAIETLTEAIEGYKIQLNEEKQNVVEQLGSFYPSIRDVETELANVYLRAGKLDDAANMAQSVVARTEKILGPDSPKLFDALTVLSTVYKQQGKTDDATRLQSRLSKLAQVSDSVVSISTKFDLLRTTYSSIEKNDRSSYLQTITELLRIYSKEAPGENISYVTNLNLFCALTSVSRKLADRRQFDDANNLIDKLISQAEEQETVPTVVPMLQAEKALNAEIAGVTSTALWSAVDERACFATTPVDKRALQGRSEGLSDRLKSRARLENLRRLGMLYIDAGETQRADIVLHRALRFSAKLDVDDTFPEINPLCENSLLFIELANIESIKGNSVSADEYSKTSSDALQKAFGMITQYTQHKDQYLKTFRYRATRLADQLLKSGRPKAGITYLDQVKSKFSPEIDLSDTFNLPRGVSREELRSRAALHAYLSRLQLLQNQPKDASSCIKQAIAERQDDVPFSLWILGSEIEIREKNDALAAHYLSESVKTFDALYFKFKMNQSRRELLEKAYTLAKHSKHFDQSEMMNIALRLAERPDYGQDSKQSLELYKEVYKLLPDSETRKADLAMRIANMEVAESEDLNVTPPSSQRDRSDDRDAAPSERLQGLKRAAVLAETTKRPDANMFWSRLACAQLEAKKTEAALDSYRHNFTLKRYPQHGVHPDFFISSLVRHNLFKEAEAILNEQLKNSTLAYGPDSFATANAMAQLTAFYINRGRDAEALNALDKLLSLDLRKLEASVSSAPSAVTLINTSAASLPANHRGDFALVVFKRLLDRQRQLFGEDERSAQTLIQIAKVNSAMKNFAEAHKNLLAAIAIKKLYVGQYLAEQELMAGLLPVLKGLGKEEEAKQFQATHQSPLSEESAPRPDRGRHELAYSRSASAAIQEKLMLEELDSARVQAPYSQRTISVLEDMMFLALSEKNWPLLLKATSGRVSIFERYVDTLAGRTYGCLIPTLQRADYYARAAEAETAMNKPEEAAKWIRRATSNLVELTDQECLKLAKQAVQCHDKEQAAVLADKAEVLFEDQPYFLGEVSKIWQTIGRQDRADNLSKRAAKLSAEQQQARERQNKSPFNGVQL